MSFKIRFCRHVLLYQGFLLIQKTSDVLLDKNHFFCEIREKSFTFLVINIKLCGDSYRYVGILRYYDKRFFIISHTYQT
jgi:hypothetical protein